MHYDTKLPSLPSQFRPKEIHHIVQSSSDVVHLVVVIIVSTSVVSTAGVSTRVIIISSLGTLGLSLLN